MKKLWDRWGWIVTTILGSAIFGVSYALFLSPANLNAGGISGLAAVIVELVNPQGNIPFLTIGTLTVVINLPLFAFGGIRIGKRFFFGSLLGMLISSLVMDNFPYALELDTLLAALYGGVMAGFGVGMVFLSGTSTGGSDIIVRLVKLKARNWNLGQISIGFDVIVIALTGLVFGNIEHALYTGVAIFLVGKMMDMVVYGFDNSKVAWIITKEHVRVVQAIDEKLGRGATYFHGMGTYSQGEMEVIMVAISPKQVAELKDLVIAIDPQAFVVLQEAHQVLGDGFIKHDEKSL